MDLCTTVPISLAVFGGVGGACALAFMALMVLNRQSGVSVSQVLWADHRERRSQGYLTDEGLAYDLRGRVCGGVLYASIGLFFLWGWAALCSP